MKIIRKIPLLIRQIQRVDLPRGGEVLTVQVLDGDPHIFALVDLDEPIEQRIVYLINTEQEFDDTNMQYIGTFQGHTGVAVWHVFELARESVVKTNRPTRLLDELDLRHKIQTILREEIKQANIGLGPRSGDV